MMAVTCSGSSFAQTSNDSELAADFRDPGTAARPRAYWNWLNGDVSLPDLTRDLEEAKAKGMGGLDMWDTEAMRNPADLDHGLGVVSEDPSGTVFIFVGHGLQTACKAKHSQQARDSR